MTNEKKPTKIGSPQMFLVAMSKAAVIQAKLITTETWQEAVKAMLSAFCGSSPMAKEIEPLAQTQLLRIYPTIRGMKSTLRTYESIEMHISILRPAIYSMDTSYEKHEQYGPLNSTTFRTMVDHLPLLDDEIYVP